VNIDNMQEQGRMIHMSTPQSSAAPSTLDDIALETLASAIRGDVIRPGDSEYDTARSIWNGMIDKRPAVIVRCSGTADVVEAVRFARVNNLLVAVRAGGHNAAGNAVCDGGIVIDLSAMNGVWVDADRRVAVAQGGATWGDFDRETHLHGLATTGGAISTTGIAGLTLGGGLGWLMRKYGMACDNLVAAEMVTADGEVLRASESENPELFWGLRGGGGNFGIVTSFEFQLHPVSTVLGGMLVHPAERAREMLQFYREFTSQAADETTIFSGLMISPEGAPIGAMVACDCGDPETAAERLRPLREYGPPLADMIGPVPYPQHQTIMDEAFPSGLNVYWRSHFLTSLNDEVIDILLEHFAGMTSPLSAILLEHFGGAVSRVGPDETAFPHRAAEYNLAIIARWTDPTGADAHIAWTRQLHEALRPHSSGVYVNYLGEEGEDRVREAYSAAQYERLAALKRRYDPTNFFRLNQNIRPS
jgi:FAD/FMN-containing dehydrogenase